MKKIIPSVLTALVIIAGVVMSILSGFNLSELQLETLKILAIVCGACVLYCFVVGEITRNTSQMDKLWSLTPIAYAWIVAGMSGMNFRTVIFAVIVTIWGARLTYNFARKGAYSIRFWEGVEDYRWAILREKKPFTNKFVWAIFDLVFISFYQNALVLAITLPSLAVMESVAPFGVVDALAIVFAVGFVTLEIVADEYQWNFHQTKKKLLKEYGSLDKLPTPYNLGFNTTGVWSVMRHPNYLGEQGLWVALYFLSVGAGVCAYGIFNWTMIGCLLLVFLFMGSSVLGEGISKSKYPEYERYQNTVCKYLPIRKFK